MSLSEAAARAELTQAYRQVVDMGLTELSSGNLSRRLGDGMLVSPTGASGETICDDALVFVDAQGRWAPGARPSSEWLLHLKIYQRYPQTQAVVHTHSPHCVAVSCHCRPLPGFHYMVGVFGGDDVPCVPYSTFGSEKLAVDVAEALKDRTACLMSNHGMTARGESTDSAIRLAHRLEISCRDYILSRALGEPRLLTPEEWADFRQRISSSRYG